MSERENTSGFEPIQFTRVVTEGVGRPRNDGTRGSDLYAVPLQLSGTPSGRWSQFFVDCWNHPPRWSTMHRAGIARVSGDTIVLDGTTIDEVEKHHLETARLCIDQANRNEGKRLDRERQRKDRDDAKRQEHEAHVAEVAERMNSREES